MEGTRRARIGGRSPDLGPLFDALADQQLDSRRPKAVPTCNRNRTDGDPYPLAFSATSLLRCAR